MKNKNQLQAHCSVSLDLGIVDWVPEMLTLMYDLVSERLEDFILDESKMSIRKVKSILKCDSYPYFGDMDTKEYHQRECSRLKEIPLDKLHGCGKNPEKSGFHACTLCIQSLPQETPLSSPPKKAASQVKATPKTGLFACITKTRKNGMISMGI